MKKSWTPAAEFIEQPAPSAPRSRVAGAKAAHYRREAERVRQLASQARPQEGGAGYIRAAQEYAALAELLGG